MPIPSPLAFIRKIIAPFQRNLEAAGGGRRWGDATTISSLNADILAGATVAARRAAGQARNNPWLTAGISSLVGNAVGTGIRPRSRHPDPAVRDALHALWERWGDHVDAAGLHDQYGAQALAVRTMIESGECFTRLCLDGTGPVPLRLEFLDREQVPLDRHVDLGGGARIRAGIELAANGRRVAYHALMHRPGDPFAPMGAGFNTVRLPAEDVVHLFQPLAPGQLRGLTWLAPVLLRLHDLDRYEDAALMKAKMAALFCGFVTNTDGEIQQWDESTYNNVGLDPGAMVVLPTGTDIKFSDPGEPPAFGEFVKSNLRSVAAGLGVTYEQLTGDYADVTYSSCRASLVEIRRRVEQLQYNVIVHQHCRPIWQRFVTLAVLCGALPAHDFEQNPAPYLSVDWLTPKFDYVDPSKDVKADIEAINAGLKSRTQAVAERGYDVELVDAEIAADRDRERRLGLALAAVPDPKEAAHV